MRVHQRRRRRSARHLPHVRARLHRARRDLLVRRQPPRASLEGGLTMSTSVLFDAPGPDRRPAPDLQRRHRARSLVGAARRAWSGGSTTTGSSSTPCGSRSSRPTTSGPARRRPARHPEDGLHRDPRRRRVRPRLRRRQAVATTAGCAGRAGPSSSSSAPIPVLLLMIFIWFVLGIQNDGSSYWGVVIALTLYNGSVLAEVLRAGVLARAQGPGGGGVRHRHAQEPGDEPGAAAAGGEDHAAGDHQPVRGGAQGHRARASTSWRRASPTSASRSTCEFDNRIPTIIVIAAHLHRDQPDPDLRRHLGAEEVRRREEAARDPDGRRHRRRHRRAQRQPVSSRAAASGSPRA